MAEPRVASLVELLVALMVELMVELMVGLRVAPSVFLTVDQKVVLWETLMVEKLVA